MASFDQKLRTLSLMEILLERTDDEHMLNASELCTILDQEYGISTDRRTIYTEMEILDKFGLDIQQKKGKCPGYYIGARDFELPELKLLVDAVQSSKFITEKKSKELIQKLEKLCCKTDAEMLSRYVFIVNRPKTENETVYYNVDYIHTAIYENKQIKFHYAEWTVKKELKLKKNGAFYVVSPWALTWDGDYYYLTGYCDEREAVRTYRVDRIKKQPELLKEKAVKKPKGYNVSKYTTEVFRMFSTDEAVDVTLLCDNCCMNAVVDKFGKKVQISSVGEEQFRTTVKVCTSPTFYRWVFGSAGKIVIEDPVEVRNAYKKMRQKSLDSMN